MEQTQRTDGTAVVSDRTDAAASDVLVATRDLVKTFGGARALDRVRVDLTSGEVRGLVGENGSGKSTFIKVLSGYHKPDAGTVAVRGRPVPLPIRLDELPDTTIAFVHQDLGLVGDLSVLENFFVRDIAATQRRSWRDAFVPRRAYRQHIRACFDRFALSVPDVDQAVGELSPLQRALIAIVRAVDEIERSGAAHSLLVLDEPTVYLPGDQRGMLYRLIRDVVAARNSVLLVSHDIDEVLQVADNVTIFRDGRVIDTVASERTTRRDVVEMMVGLAPGRAEARSPAASDEGSTAGRAGEPVVSLTHVRSRSVADATLQVRAGEIVGLAGLAGSGYELVPRIVYGMLPVEAGELVIGGLPISRHHHSPTAAIERGVVLVPRDRIREGGVVSMTVNENVFFPIRTRFTELGMVRWRAAWAWVHEQLEKFDVRPPDGTRELGTLSGGNQQKAIFAKWSQMAPTLMLLEEPTQGVDVGARLGIWRFVRKAAAEGAGVLVASSDYEELVELCDRVVIMVAGAVVAELPRVELSKQNILNACYARAGTERTGS
jgi:ribose transport system ATP-binding protein